MPREKIGFLVMDMKKRLLLLLIKWWVSFVRGQCKEMISENLKSSSKVQYFPPISSVKIFEGYLSNPKILQPNPLIILPVCKPILPVPIIPTVFLCISKPKSPEREKFSSLTLV